MAKQLQLMAHLSRWLAARDLEPGALDRVEIERFVRERRASHAHLASALGLGGLLGYLRGLGVVPAAGSREAPTPAGELLDRYAEYLLAQRGLKPGTVHNYCHHVRALLADHERLTAARRSARSLLAMSARTVVRCWAAGPSVGPRVARTIGKASAVRDSARAAHDKGMPV